MNATCPVCNQPCIAAELHAYGKCEDCYSPTTSSHLDGLAAEVIAKHSREPKTEFQHGCGGGHRVIKTTRGLS